MRMRPLNTSRLRTLRQFCAMLFTVCSSDVFSVRTARRHKCYRYRHIHTIQFYVMLLRLPPLYNSTLCLPPGLGSVEVDLDTSKNCTICDAQFSNSHSDLHGNAHGTALRERTSRFSKPAFESSDLNRLHRISIWTRNILSSGSTVLLSILVYIRVQAAAFGSGTLDRTYLPDLAEWHGANRPPGLLRFRCCVRLCSVQCWRLTLSPLSFVLFMR